MIAILADYFIKDGEISSLKIAKALALKYDLLGMMKKAYKIEHIKLTEEEANTLGQLPADLGYRSVSTPLEEYYQMPEESVVEFIGCEEDIEKAKSLIDMEVIGVDSEWRPTINNLATGHRVALLQVGNRHEVFLFDMLVMPFIPEFDELMTKVFSNPKSIIVGMSFHNDLREFYSDYPNLNFYKHIANLLDVQPMYGDYLRCNPEVAKS